MDGFYWPDGTGEELEQGGFSCPARTTHYHVAVHSEGDVAQEEASFPPYRGVVETDGYGLSIHVG
jgi:hypothetical protein